MRVLGNSQQAKGEFANQTCFVDAASPSDVQCGHQPTHHTLGWVLMSDGGAEKLVASRRQPRGCPPGAVARAHRAGQARRKTLAVAYHEAAMWQRTTLTTVPSCWAGRSQPQPTDRKPKASMARTLYLIAYDVCHPKRLAKVGRYFHTFCASP